MEAGRWFRRGLSQAEVARRLKVSRMAVSKWHAAWEKNGAAGLKSKGKPGQDPRLTTEDVRAVRRVLLRGPQKAGFATDLWTLARMAKVIREVASVSYHPSHVWKVLRAMNFSAQMPSAKPRERNEGEIKAWQEKVWPQIKKRGSKYTPA